MKKLNDFFAKINNFFAKINSSLAELSDRIHVNLGCLFTVLTIIIWVINWFLLSK